ncbi:MAG: hypothetical protein NTX12_03265 [Actinobacteria bacterium]|nr:hypothetical protein [Actinomycetota bacterium]
MMSMAALRSFALNLVLFASLIISHHLGGGNFSFSPYLVSLLVFSFIYFTIRPTAEFTGPQLAGVLMLFQAIGHLTLGSTAGASDTRMVASHVIVFILSYLAVERFDKAILAMFSLLFSFFSLTLFIAIKYVQPRPSAILDQCHEVAPQLLLWSSCLNRAPPLFAIG